MGRNQTQRPVQAHPGGSEGRAQNFWGRWDFAARRVRPGDLESQGFAQKRQKASSNQGTGPKKLRDGGGAVSFGAEDGSTRESPIVFIVLGAAKAGHRATGKTAFGRVHECGACCVFRKRMMRDRILKTKIIFPVETSRLFHRNHESQGFWSSGKVA